MVRSRSVALGQSLLAEASLHRVIAYHGLRPIPLGLTVVDMDPITVVPSRSGSYRASCRGCLLSIPFALIIVSTHPTL